MFLEYEKIRDCIFFFGAGASYSDGVPLQNSIVPEILNPSNINFEKSVLRRRIENFIIKYFPFSVDDDYYPSLETLFSFIDYFVINEISLDKDYSCHNLMDLRECLISVIYYVTSQSKKKVVFPAEEKLVGRSNDSVYSFFWERLRKTRRNISIITTNYDNLLDDAFDRWFYLDYGLIDYCVDFINYTSESIMGFDWWINPRKPIPWEKPNTRPIKLIKIHGSLNWKYCNCCSQAILTPWNNDIHLDTGKFTLTKDCVKEKWNDLHCCPRDGNPLSPIILPPSHNKVLTHPIIQSLMIEAQNEIRVARKIVFIGYSFPEADMHIKAIFNKCLSKNVEIIVVNPGLTNESRYMYKSLSGNVDFIAEKFEDALVSGLIEKILPV